MTQNAINNTILNANFTVPNGTIISSGTITSSAGNINSTVGSVSAGTTVTAGTGLTVTTGNADIIAGNLNIGTAVPSNPYDLSIDRSINGRLGISIQNISAGASAASTMQCIVEPATHDAFCNYIVNGGQNWSVGLDNSDSDAFKITTGNDPSAGTEVFVATTAGAVTMNGGAVNIGTDNAANAITIGTGTTARLINIGLSAAPHVINIGVNNGASSLGLNAGTGDMRLISGDEITLDAAGVLELNSTGGAISVGNDANAQAINIGTGAAARTITIGNNTGATAVNIDIGTGDFTLDSVTGNIITALDSGEVTMPLQPAFLAFNSVTDSNVTGDGTDYTIVFNSEVYDQGNDFDGTSTFTAPITGRYFFATTCFIEQNTATQTFIRFSASNRLIYGGIFGLGAVSSGNLAINASTFMDMDAADTCVIILRCSGTTLTVDVVGDGSGVTVFSGFLAC